MIASLQSIKLLPTTNICHVQLCQYGKYHFGGNGSLSVSSWNWVKLDRSEKENGPMFQRERGKSLSAIHGHREKNTEKYIFSCHLCRSLAVRKLRSVHKQLQRRGVTTDSRARRPFTQASRRFRAQFQKSGHIRPSSAFEENGSNRTRSWTLERCVEKPYRPTSPCSMTTDAFGSQCLVENCTRVTNG